MSRFIDAGIAILLFILFAPVSALIALAVFVTMGSPIFFRQERIGKHEVSFTLVKFRTMLSSGCGEALADMDRITTLGRFLRKTSLDELPSLINVIAGQMSLVGPRPLPLEYLAKIGDKYRNRSRVRPGLTGLAQIHGRTSLDWEQRFSLDLDYVRDRSLWLDLSIIFRSITVVLSGRGADTHEAGPLPDLSNKND